MDDNNNDAVSQSIGGPLRLAYIIQGMGFTHPGHHELSHGGRTCQGCTRIACQNEIAEIKHPEPKSDDDDDDDDQKSGAFRASGVTATLMLSSVLGLFPF